MTDERKYVLLIAATILAARKLASLDHTTGVTPPRYAWSKTQDEAKLHSVQSDYMGGAFGCLLACLAGIQKAVPTPPAYAVKRGDHRA